MHYERTLTLRDGSELTLRNGTAADGAEALRVFLETHEETDYLLTYPDECSLTPEAEGAFLQEKADSEREIELLAIVDGRLAGMGGIEAVGSCYKLRHRAEFGISVSKAFRGRGIGRRLTEACIECACAAGYEQLELSVVDGNESAAALYRSLGFIEWGRDPRGFRSRVSGYQTLVHMRMEL